MVAGYPRKLGPGGVRARPFVPTPGSSRLPCPWGGCRPRPAGVLVLCRSQTRPRRPGFRLPAGFGVRRKGAGAGRVWGHLKFGRGMRPCCSAPAAVAGGGLCFPPPELFIATCSHPAASDVPGVGTPLLQWGIPFGEGRSPPSPILPPPTPLWAPQNEPPAGCLLLSPPCQPLSAPHRDRDRDRDPLCSPAAPCTKAPFIPRGAASTRRTPCPTAGLGPLPPNLPSFTPAQSA